MKKLENKVSTRLPKRRRRIDLTSNKNYHDLCRRILVRKHRQLFVKDKKRQLKNFFTIKNYAKEEEEMMLKMMMLKTKEVIDDDDDDDDEEDYRVISKNDESSAIKSSYTKEGDEKEKISLKIDDDDDDDNDNKRAVLRSRGVEIITLTEDMSDYDDDDDS